MRETGRRPSWLWWVPFIVVGLIAVNALAGRLVPGVIPRSEQQGAAETALRPAYLLSPAVLLLVGVVALAGWLFVSARIAALLGRLPSRTRLALVGFAGLLYVALELRLAYATARLPASDPGALFAAARDQVLGVNGGQFFVRYFSIYPNNGLLADVYYAILSTVHAAGGGDHQYAIALPLVNAIVLTVPAVLTVVLVRRELGATAAVFCSGLVVVFLFFSPWLHILYSDTAGMAFPIALLTLASFARTAGRRGRIALWAAIGLVGAVGMAVKPTVVFALVAVVAVPLLLRPRQGRRHVTALAAAAVAFLAVHTLLPHAVDHGGVTPVEQADPAQKFPITHFLAMGTTGVGAYNAADVGRMENTPPDQRFALGLRLWRQRVSELGPAGYAHLLDSKLVWTVGYGTFGQWGEGHMTKPPLNSDGISRFARSFYDGDGSRHGIALDMWDAIWLAGLLLVCVPLILRRGWLERVDLFGPIALSIIMLVAFHMLFETRARYLYLYVPVLLVLMTGGACQLRAAVSAAWTTRRAPGSLVGKDQPA
ncbi:glycosyltransferase family 39 protein [Nocardioides sp. AN3]